MKDEIKLAWAAFIVACIALCFLIIKDTVLPRYPEKFGDKEASYTTEEYQEISLTLSKRDLFAQWVMAIGTLALFGLTLLSVHHANRTSEQALAEAKAASAETKRSVDAFINAERGYLTLVGAYRKVGPSREVIFHFENSGKTTINILGFGHEFQTLENLNDRPKPPIFKYYSVERLVKVGDGFGSKFFPWVEEGKKELTITTEQLEEVKGGKVLVCSFGFQYTTPFGLHLACYTFSIPHGPDTRPLSYWGEGVRFDRLLGGI